MFSFGAVSTAMAPAQGPRHRIPKWVPAGLVHAVQLRGPDTLCGRATGNFLQWFDHDFEELEGVQQCAACADRVSRLPGNRAS